MSVSNRFREIAREISEFQGLLVARSEPAGKGGKSVNKAGECLQEWVDQVGDIPRMSLEFKLTPVLLKAHNYLDRARLTFEEEGFDEQATVSWGLQQKIYRLLNDI